MKGDFSPAWWVKRSHLLEFFQLTNTAAKIDEYVGTHRQAAKALALVAKTGKFTGDQLEKVAATAVLMDNVIGKAIDETVSEFEKLAKDPAKAAAELNEQYHFLTASVYEQITALEKAGKHTEAGKIATEAYAEALNQRSAEITDNLGYIERGWKAVKEVAAEGWDAMLGIGRDDPYLELERLEKRLSVLTFDGAVPNGAINGIWGTVDNPEVAHLKARQEELKKDIEAKEKKAEQDRARNEINSKAITSQQSFSALLDETLTKEEKRLKAYAELEKYIANIRAADPASALISDENITKVKKVLDERFAEKEQKESDAGQKLLSRYQQQEAQLQQQLETREKVGKQAGQLLEFTQQIVDLKAKKELTADEKSRLVYAEKIVAQLDINKKLEEELAQRERISREIAYQNNLTNETLVMQQRYADELAAFGTGNRNNQRLAGRNVITRNVQAKKDDLTNKLATGEIGQDSYDTNMQALEDELATRLQLYDKHYQDLDEARGKWQNGANRAFDNYMDSASDIAGQTENLFNNAFNSMEDAIVQFAMTGKASFSDFATAILADLARIAARQAIVQMLSNVIGSYSSGGVVGDNTSTTTDIWGDASGPMYAWTGGYTGAGGKYQPAGIVHKGEVVFSQEDVARHGGVASVERLRKGFKGFADGGVVGGNYAASVPSTGSGASGINITQHIKIDNGNSESMGDSDKLGKAYAKAADEGTRKEIAKQLKPGGMIWAAMRGY